LNSSWV